MLKKILGNIIPDLSGLGEAIKLVCLTILIVVVIKYLIGPLFSFIFGSKRWKWIKE